MNWLFGKAGLRRRETSISSMRTSSSTSSRFARRQRRNSAPVPSQKISDANNISESSHATEDFLISTNRNRRKDKSPRESKKQKESYCLFPQFSKFNDDIVLCILSFVAYAPFEEKQENSPPSFFAEKSTRSKSRSNHERLVKEYVGMGIQPTLIPRSNNNNKSTIASVRFYTDLHPERFGSLSHVLPLVCKRFFSLCYESNVLWKEVLLRLAAHSITSDVNDDENVWGSNALKRLYVKLSPRRKSSAGKEIINNCVPNCLNDLSNNEELISQTCMIVQRHKQEDLLRMVDNDNDVNTSTRRASKTANVHRGSTSSSHLPPAYVVYKLLAKIELQTFTGPVFFMPSNNIRLGHSINLHFFEHRYRILIRELMSKRQPRDRVGIPISSEPRPKFIYCNDRSLGTGRYAYIVEVMRCRIHEDGRADLQLLPITKVVIVGIRERQRSAGLYEGRVRKFVNIERVGSRLIASA